MGKLLHHLTGLMNSCRNRQLLICRISNYLHDLAEQIQHITHDAIVREILTLQTADFQTTFNQEMLYQLVASLKLKEGRIVFQRLVGAHTMKTLKDCFSKWGNLIKERNAKMMDSDKVCWWFACFLIDLSGHSDNAGYANLYYVNWCAHSFPLHLGYVCTHLLSILLLCSTLHRLGLICALIAPKTHCLCPLHYTSCTFVCYIFITATHHIQRADSSPFRTIQRRWRLHAISNQEVDLQAWYHAVFFNEIYRLRGPFWYKDAALPVYRSRYWSDPINVNTEYRVQLLTGIQNMIFYDIHCGMWNDSVRPNSSDIQLRVFTGELSWMLNALQLSFAAKKSILSPEMNHVDVWKSSLYEALITR